MNRKNIGNVFYYECPFCGNTMNKPPEPKEADVDDSTNKQQILQSRSDGLSQ